MCYLPGLANILIYSSTLLLNESWNIGCTLLTMSDNQRVLPKNTMCSFSERTQTGLIIIIAIHPESSGLNITLPYIHQKNITFRKKKPSLDQKPENMFSKYMYITFVTLDSSQIHTSLVLSTLFSSNCCDASTFNGSSKFNKSWEMKKKQKLRALWEHYILWAKVFVLFTMDWLNNSQVVCLLGYINWLLSSMNFLETQVYFCNHTY